MYYRDILLPLHERIVNEAQLQYNAMQLGPVQLLRARERQIETAVSYVETLREYCLSKVAAIENTPFGEDVLVFKVAGKIFALAPLDEVPPTANLKCDPDLALELRDRYEQVRPGYHMNKKHWNTVELDSGIPDTELRRMIDHSYELVVKSLPKTARAKL